MSCMLSSCRADRSARTTPALRYVAQGGSSLEFILSIRARRGKAKARGFGGFAVPLPRRVLCIMLRPQAVNYKTSRLWLKRLRSIP